jgi:hypothetical protein
LFFVNLLFHHQQRVSSSLAASENLRPAQYWCVFLFFGKRNVHFIVRLRAPPPADQSGNQAEDRALGIGRSLAIKQADKLHPLRLKTTLCHPNP